MGIFSAPAQRLAPTTPTLTTLTTTTTTTRTTMGRVKKSTRKFEKNHLKDTLDQRKAQAKIKQQFALRDRNKKKRQKDRGNDSEDEAEASAAAAKKAKEKKDGPELFDDMTVEQFFQGGFEIPEAGPGAKKEKKKSKKEKKDKEGKTAKRKRTKEDDEEAGSPVPEGEGGEDELGAHVADLSALAEKDPEFYKYLQDNDAELLDFAVAEHDDLAGIDDLSDGEEEEPKKKTKKRKKSKDVEDDAEDPNASVEVTLKDVETWKTALVENKSLRSLKKVVLAFRAAAHVNDVQDDKRPSYKYSITNPDGRPAPPSGRDPTLPILESNANIPVQSTTSCWSWPSSTSPMSSITTSPSRSPPLARSASRLRPRNTAPSPLSSNRTPRHSSTFSRPSPTPRPRGSFSTPPSRSSHTSSPSANSSRPS